MTVNLGKNLSNVIGVEVKLDDDVVGKVIEYNEETGNATIKINEEHSSPVWKKIAGDYVGLVSSRKK